MSTTKINVRVTQRDFTTSIYTFDSESEVKAFCNEEVEWESTLEVFCHALGFRQYGSFATPAEQALLHSRLGVKV